ncbi:MAG: InlB B-repeat-containing protein, partial [Cyclobacteriaceae bacterium]
SDIDAYDGFGITKVRVYINDQANNATVKIWQGTDSENLTEYVSQPFTQQTNTWVEVELENSYYIDASEELWFGVEYDDPGDGVYPLGRDAGPEVPGKGNMILWDGSWIELTDLNIALTYNWNLQALLAMPSGTLYTLSLETNPNDGGNPSGAGNYEEATNVLINANTAENYNFVNWTIGGNEISIQEDYYYTMPDYDVSMVANYEEKSTSISEYEITDYDFDIFPNPNKGSFNVSLELPVATNIELELYDVLGRKVFNLPPETLNKGNNQITVNRQADLQNGLYILRVNAYEIDTNQFIFRNDMKILVK